MGVVEDLRSHGLDITDDTATVTVQGVTQRVTIDTSPGAGVGLLIEGPVDGWAGNTPPVDAALVAAGDTEVDVTSGTARLTRHLATTDVAGVYDAVFELAKVGARIGLRLADAGATAAATAEAAAASEPVSSSEAEPEASVGAAQPAAAAATAAAPWATGATSDPAVSPTTNEPTQPVSAAVAASGEFWFYVDSEQQLMSGGQGSQAVGGLRPGQWYRASREEAGWVKATDEYGRVGWVRASAAHRHQG